MYTFNGTYISDFKWAEINLSPNLCKSSQREVEVRFMLTHSEEGLDTT